MKRTASIALALLLAACTDGEKPRAADFVPPAESQTDIGDLRVRYNALPTLSLNDAVARQYGVPKDQGSGLVLVALRRVVGGEELAVKGEVSAEAFDLQGTRQGIDFSAVQIGEYTDHIGVFAVSARDTYRFQITVKADGRTQTVKFQRNF